MDAKEDDPAWDDGFGPGADVDPLMIARAGIYAAAVNPPRAAAASVHL